MTTAQIEKPAAGGAVLMRMLKDDGAVRRLAMSSGLSGVTLRSIAATGTVNSYVTAMALELATDGAVTADSITTSSTKGADLYSREPARSLLLLAFKEETTTTRLLARHGLTQYDLFKFMNEPAGRFEGTKQRVIKALAAMSIEIPQEFTQ